MNMWFVGFSYTPAVCAVIELISPTCTLWASGSASAFQISLHPLPCVISVFLGHGQIFTISRSWVSLDQAAKGSRGRRQRQASEMEVVVVVVCFGMHRLR